MRWEYCEVWWQPQSVLVNVFTPQGARQQRFPTEEWPTAFANLGADGWELVTAMSSPTAIHEYWYYFKRPLP